MISIAIIFFFRGRPAKSKVENNESEPLVPKKKSKLPQIDDKLKDYLESLLNNQLKLPTPTKPDSKNVGRPAKEKQNKSTPKISDTPVDEEEKSAKISILKPIEVYGSNVETGQEIVDKINVTVEVSSVVESNSQTVKVSYFLNLFLKKLNKN